MSQKIKRNHNITSNDMVLAPIYYSVLLDLAKKKESYIAYGDLANKGHYHLDANREATKFSALGVGRILFLIRIFTNQKERPDLSCLVYNKVTGECAGVYTDEFDAVKARREVLDYDWSLVTNVFDINIADAKIWIAEWLVKANAQHSNEAPVKKVVLKKKVVARKAVAPMKMTRVDAADIRWKYYNENKDKFPASIKLHSEFIDDLIIGGVAVEDAFNQALAKCTPK